MLFIYYDNKLSKYEKYKFYKFHSDQLPLMGYATWLNIYIIHHKCKQYVFHMCYFSCTEKKIC